MALSLFNRDWPFSVFDDGTPMSISLHVPRYLRQASTGLSQYLTDEFRQMQVRFSSKFLIYKFTLSVLFHNLYFGTSYITD